MSVWNTPLLVMSTCIPSVDLGLKAEFVPLQDVYFVLILITWCHLVCEQPISMCCKQSPDLCSMDRPGTSRLECGPIFFGIQGVGVRYQTAIAIPVEKSLEVGTDKVINIPFVDWRVVGIRLDDLFYQRPESVTFQEITTFFDSLHVQGNDLIPSVLTRVISGCY